MAAAPEPQYGGYSRFELELEFVQCLANPAYLHYLARQKLLEKPEFVAYLAYLQYFKEPQYIKHLQHPGPTLRALELLQQERFRKDIADLNVLNFMTIQWLENAIPPRAE
ncbi:SOH1-domain-containing protein [Westerdykella ornata]|uniref:Mediator of RNA polymerase II transcription subunit 31 n=1 Tax=Westerdykella ornata TaxID=318751 RepID=A0A6A6JFR2_WESOR|nr:SOH1-domain-containing protein [Westerdykella ornata]KAF2275460.1 SOH1-domain-containing protein [Westerdykella ornata]